MSRPIITIRLAFWRTSRRDINHISIDQSNKTSGQIAGHISHAALHVRIPWQRITDGTCWMDGWMDGWMGEDSVVFIDVVVGQFIPVTSHD